MTFLETFLSDSGNNRCGYASERYDALVHEAMVTSGKAVTFTAVTMIISTLFWVTSNIRFNAEMGLLLAIWMFISYVGSQTLLPVLILVFKPNFILKEAGHAENRTLVRID